MLQSQGTGSGKTITGSGTKANVPPTTTIQTDTKSNPGKPPEKNVQVC